MCFRIQSTSFCASGLAPRWTWWVRGVNGSQRYGVIGTDESGNGLYVFIHRGNDAPERQELLGKQAFSLGSSRDRKLATDQLIAALTQLGWFRGN